MKQANITANTTRIEFMHFFTSSSMCHIRRTHSIKKSKKSSKSWSFQARARALLTRGETPQRLYWRRNYEATLAPTLGMPLIPTVRAGERSLLDIGRPPEVHTLRVDSPSTAVPAPAELLVVIAHVLWLRVRRRRLRRRRREGQGQRPQYCRGIG